MPVGPYVHRFLRKFVLDAIPGALASLVGALFFAHQWAQAPQPVRLETVERVALQSEQVAQMIRDEHALMIEFLKKEQEREVARAPLTIKELKAREALAAAPASRRETVADLKAPTAPEVKASVPEVKVAAVSEVKAAVAVPPARPSEVVTIESGPLVAEPEPAPRGTLARIAAVAAIAIGWTDRAVDATGVRQIPALIRAIPPRADAGEPLDTLSGARFVSASR